MSNLERLPELIPAGKLIRYFGSPAFTAMLQKVNESYYYWDKVKYLNMPAGIVPEEVWSAAKLVRSGTPYTIRFGINDFRWSLTNRMQQQLHHFDLNIGGSLESRGFIPEGEKAKYLINSVMEEAIASSQIEGAVTTRKKAKEMLRQEKPPRNTSDRMIVNNYKTIQRILELKSQPLSADLLLEIHKLITNKTLKDPGDEGMFRTTNDVYVFDHIAGEIVHTPPSYTELPALLKEVYGFFNEENKEVFIHPIIKASILHFIIGYIHPFVDGNGRTARALFYWYLLRQGYWLTEYLSLSRIILKSKTQYEKAFIYTETDDNDVTYFLQYSLQAMERAYDELRAYLEKKMAEKKKLTDFVLIDGINERQAYILKLFSEETDLMLTVREWQTRNQVSEPTARTDLQTLADQGYLQQVWLNGKKQAFARGDKFEHILKKALLKRRPTLFDDR